MTYTTKAGGQQSPSFLFPEFSNQTSRFTDTTLSLLTDAPAETAEAPIPLITAVLASTEGSPALPADASRESLESSYLAQSAKGAVFEKGVAIATTPDVALNSHQVLSDSLPSAGADTASSSKGISCGCRACSVLAVSNGDGAEAWDTTNDQAPLVMGNVVTLGTGVDLSKVFQLHSNPTATKTIFLDFDGYAINNTPWENGGNLSLKSFYSSFDPTARTEIQRIWQRVAEDFAPFNVNVTTQDPGSENLRKFGTGDDRWGIRVAFTSNLNLLTGKAITNAGGGGTAYYNSFNWSTDDVALVFNRGEYTAAETASHEVGHALGLRHDGAGTSTEYYGGHGGSGPTSWGTIMGAAWLGNDENLTQWSKGEYAGANNTQDDLATITNGNGFTYAADDHGNSFATATALAGLTFSSFGVIERNTDIDMFRFETAAGQVSFNIVNASRAFIGSAGSYVTEYLTARGANLDIAATLYRADQSIVQTFNPADLTTASFSINLDAGTYFLGIDGVGFGTPLASTPTGYTDYGSLGQYMLSGTVQSTISQPPPTPTPPPATNTTSTLQVLDPNGAVQLLRDSSTDLVSVQINGVTSAVRLSGSQIKASQFADRKILAAETINGQNRVLWQVVSTGQIRTWSLDSKWNYTSASALADPTSSAGLLLQQQFMVTATGTPLTTTSTTDTTTTTNNKTSTDLQVLDPNGAVQLLRDSNTDRVSVQINGVTSAVRLSGSQITASQFADRKILAAETINGQNRVLWQVVSTGQIRTWSLDSRWNYISSNTLADPNSSAGLLLQQQFMVDANGTPLAAAPLNAVTEAVDPIIGGGTSLAPAAGDDFAYDQTILEAGLPDDLSFSTEPILALAELASLSATNPTSTDPLVAPFPAAGLDSSPTTPWLVASQPLL